mgnify:CR=1 FL=1
MRSLKKRLFKLIYKLSIITQLIFWIASFADFKICKRPSRTPDFISYFEGKASSEYWYEDGYLLRSSDHWGQVSFCQWNLKTAEKHEIRFPERPNQLWYKTAQVGRVKFSSMAWNQVVVGDRQKLSEALKYFCELDNRFAVGVLSKFL